MTEFNVNTHRTDPYKDFKFRINVDGQYVAGVSKVSALARNTELVRHRKGGDSSNLGKSPGKTRFEPITLERGITHDDFFEKWAELTFKVSGNPGTSLANYKKDMIIELLNLSGQVVMAYHVFRCWVSEYQALPELDANSNAIAIEKIVLQHEGWERDRSIKEPVET